jgi:PEP-CTERM motif
MIWCRHVSVVIVVVCLSLLPARSEAAAITHPIDFGTVSAGITPFDGIFELDNDVALIRFTLDASADVSAEVTSHLASPAGFDPILTLFGPGSSFLGAFDFLTDSSTGSLSAGLLGPGNYLLALTQYVNFFSPFEGQFDFDQDADGLFTQSLFDPSGALGCTAFVAFNFATEQAECRTPAFAGSLTVEPAAVPEPGTLALLAVSAATLLARRPRRRRTVGGHAGVARD